MTMTTNDFLDALTACAHAYKWEIAVAMGSLRGTVVTVAGDSIEVCPITAVACAYDGDLWEVTEWDLAAKALAFPLAEASAIVGAADDDGVEDHGALRARLLAAVGL